MRTLISYLNRVKKFANIKIWKNGYGKTFEVRWRVFRDRD